MALFAKTAAAAPAPTVLQQRQKKAKRYKLLRAGVQAFFFLYMPGAFTAAFAGAKHIAQWLGQGQTLQLDSFVQALIFLCVCTVLFGRFFCGYVCAFGAFGDAVYALSGLVQKKLLKRRKQFSLPEKCVSYAQKIKYGVLVVLLVLCGASLYSALGGFSPWDVFARLGALKTPAAGYTLGCVLLALIAIGMMLHPRFFCQFLCPLGAIFSLLPILPAAHLQRNSANCPAPCRACQMSCPVHLKLGQGEEGECISCDACRDVCPRGNISRKFEPLGRAAAVILKAGIMAAFGYLLGLSRL